MTVLPNDPVPSIIETTVARAREFPRSDSWVPRSVETAVVIRQYGPTMRKPRINKKTERMKKVVNDNDGFKNSFN